MGHPAGLMRFRAAHPSHKNKDVARVGHPIYLGLLRPVYFGFVVEAILIGLR
jgi:hypothetical protein